MADAPLDGPCRQCGSKQPLEVQREELVDALALLVARAYRCREVPNGSATDAATEPSAGNLATTPPSVLDHAAQTPLAPGRA